AIANPQYGEPERRDVEALKDASLVMQSEDGYHVFSAEFKNFDLTKVSQLGPSSLARANDELTLNVEKLQTALIEEQRSSHSYAASLKIAETRIKTIETEVDSKDSKIAELEKSLYWKALIIRLLSGTLFLIVTSELIFLR